MAPGSKQNVDNQLQKLAEENRIIREQLTSLAVLVQDLSNKLTLSASNQTSTTQTEAPQTDESQTVTKQPKVPDKKNLSRSPFPKVQEKEFLEGDVAGRILYLTTEAKKLCQEFTEHSILIELKKAIPWSLVADLDPSASLSLEQFIISITSRFNCEEEIIHTATKLRSFKLDTGKTRTDNISNFVTAVDNFNRRCVLAGPNFTGRIWSRDRVKEHIVSHLGLEKEYAFHFREKWKSLGVGNSPEDWSREKIRAIAAEAEDTYEFLFGNRVQKRVLNANFSAPENNGENRKFQPGICWKCDKGMHRDIEGRWKCSCVATPVCEVSNCGGIHLTKFHDAVIESFLRAQRRNAFRLKRNVESAQTGNSPPIQVTIVSKQLYDHFDDEYKRLLSTKQNLQSFNKTDMKPLGTVQVNIELGSVVISTSAIVLEEAVAPFLLGLDVLKDAIINNRIMELQLGEQRVPLTRFQQADLSSWRKTRPFFYIKIDSEKDFIKTSTKEETKEILEELVDDIEELFKVKLNDCVSNEERSKVLIEKEDLLKIVKEHPNLFSIHSKAAVLKIPPVEFVFKKDMSKEAPKVSKLRPLSKYELDIVKKWLREAVGWKINTRYLEKIKRLKQPTSKTELRSFIGILNWQRRFIPKYSQRIKALTDLLKKDKQVARDWTSEQQSAFEDMKKTLTTSPILHHPNFNLDFITYSDASNTAIGGVLVQLKEGKEVVINYFSRKLSEREQDKGIPEREYMALVETLEDFRSYIYGYKIICKVDQASLKWLTDIESNKKFISYTLRLAEFDYEIELISGSKNKADWISRYVLYTRNSVQANLTSDPFYLLFKDTKTKENERFTFQKKEYILTDFEDGETLKYKGRIVIPAKELYNVAKNIHYEDKNTSHLGVKATSDIFKKIYFCPGWQRVIVDVVGSCNMCKKVKRYTSPVEKNKSLAFSLKKNRSVSMNIFGSNSLPLNKGFNAVLTIIDDFSKYTRFIPLKGKYMQEIVEKFEDEWCFLFGYPKRIHTDNEFRSEFIERWCQEHNIQQTFAAIYSPWQNGRIERTHRFLKEQLLIGKELGKDDWVKQLPNISFKLNSLVKEADILSPVEILMESKDVRNSPGLDVPKSSNTTEDVYEPGDWIYIKCGPRKKFQTDKGPYEILKKLGSNIYIADVEGKPTQISSLHIKKGFVESH
eukprot:augustus_masked-scaffold_6-processed-gene-20.7-mRNA-1 protein AED:0.45 eAED:0.45 QI:0/0/0/0.33/1/1/3/0/1175